MARTRKFKKPSADGILEAAERTFARKGYGEASLRDLITGAKVSTTAFYARFGSKEEVLRALVLRLLEELRARAMDELAHAKGLEDGVRRGVDVLTEVMAPRRALVRIALTEAAASPKLVEAVGALYAAMSALLAAEIRGLVARGQTAELDADALAWSLVGALNLQVERWAVYEHFATEELGPALHRVADALLPALAPTGVRKRVRASRTKTGS